MVDVDVSELSGCANTTKKSRSFGLNLSRHINCRRNDTDIFKAKAEVRLQLSLKNTSRRKLCCVKCASHLTANDNRTALTPQRSLRVIASACYGGRVC